MESFALYALIGLLLLVPLEMLFLVLVAALTRRREFAPRLAVPSPNGQERYGWEDMLKLSPERKPSGRRKAVISAMVILLLIVIVAAPGLFLVAPSLHLNLSLQQPANDTAVILPPPELNETPAGGIFSNLTFPGLNITAPDINLSKVFAPLKDNIGVVALVLAIVFASILVLFFIIRRRRLAVVTKSRKASEKLMMDAVVGKNGKGHKRFFSRLRKFIAPFIIAFLLVVIALLIYLLRDRIRNEFSGKLLPFAVSAKEFALNYRFYIIAGFVILAILIFLLRFIARRRQGNYLNPPS